MNNKTIKKEREREEELRKNELPTYRTRMFASRCMFSLIPNFKNGKYFIDG
jgi:hypothetical protein